MSIGNTQDGGSASTRPEEGPEQKARPRFDLMRSLGDVFRETSIFRRSIAAVWKTIPSHVPFYLLIIVVSYAAWEARTPVTIIAPFQLPEKQDLPFNGDAVADALQDSLKVIHSDIEKEREKSDQRLTTLDIDSRMTTGLLVRLHIRELEPVQVPTRFAAEVKGLSYEAIISAARAVMGTQTTVSGDVILDGKEKFILIARASNAGPWESDRQPTTADGLKAASRDLAEKMLTTRDPDLAVALFLKDGQIGRAVDLLSEVSARKPADVQATLNLCKGYEARQLYKLAIDCYQRALHLKPSQPEEVQEWLAHAHWRYGDRDDAIKSFEDLAHKRGYTGALLGLGRALDNTGQHEAALKVYDEFLASKHGSRDLAIAHLNRGVAQAESNKKDKHELALAEYRQALQYAPDDTLILTYIGVELARKGDLDAGIAQLRSAVDEKVSVDSGSFALLQLGRLLVQEGDWEGASEQFHRAVQLRPNYVQAHMDLGHVLVREGKNDGAVSEFAEATKLSPHKAESENSKAVANVWLGNDLREQGNYSAAASAYGEAIGLKRDYRLAHCELGFVLEQQGQHSQAIGEYRTALKVKSNELDSREWIILAHLRLGMALIRQGREHQAEGMENLHKAIELDRNHVESYLCLGQALYDQGNYAEAASQYGEALKIDQRSAAAHSGLALALDKQQGKVKKPAADRENVAKPIATAKK